MSNSDWIQLAALALNVLYLVWHNRKSTSNVKRVITGALTTNRSLLSRTLADIAQTISKEYGNKAVAQEVVTDAEDVIESVAHLQAGTHE